MDVPGKLASDPLGIATLDCREQSAMCYRQFAQLRKRLVVGGEEQTQLRLPGPPRFVERLVA